MHFRVRSLIFTIFIVKNHERISKVLIAWTGGRYSHTKVQVSLFLYTTVTVMAFAMSVLSVYYL